MSSIEKFTMVEMHRSELKKYPFNPRKITAEARRRLKAGLERFGLVTPLVYNKSTGYLVSGHQRLSCLDDIHETKDYSLNIAVVDLDPSKEKELVVFLNNQSSAGYWDDEAVMQIISDENIDRNSLGFSASEQDYFDRLMKESAKQDTAAMEYFKNIEESYDTMQGSAEENKDEIEEDKKTRKEKWEETINEFFPTPTITSITKIENTKKYEDLTDDEKKHRDEFRAAREQWKKKETNDGEVVLKILFTSGDNCRRWLQRNNLPPDNLVVHEKEFT